MYFLESLVDFAWLGVTTAVSVVCFMVGLFVVFVPVWWLLAKLS